MGRRSRGAAVVSFLLDACLCWSTLEPYWKYSNMTYGALYEEAVSRSCFDRSRSLYISECMSLCIDLSHRRVAGTAPEAGDKPD